MSASAPTDAAAVVTGRVASNEALRRWSILGLLCLAFIAAYVDRQNLAAAVIDPGFKGYFNLSPTDRGLLHSAFFWSYLLLQIPSGWLVDRFGAKKVLAAGFVLWSLTSAATGLSTTFAALFIFRMFLGVGEAGVNPAGMRWIRFNIPEEQRGLAVGIYQASAKIGLAVGVPVAGMLIAAFDWRAMFVILGIGCMLWLVPWMLLVRDDDRQIEAAQQKASGASSVPFGRIMASPVIWGTVLGTFAYQYFLYFTMTWMPTYFVERRNLDLKSMWLFTFVQFIGMAVVAILAGWAADRMIKKGGDPVKVRKRFAIAGLLVGSTQLIGAFAQSTNVAIFFAVLSHLRPGTDDRQLLGADPDADPGRGRGPHRRRPEHGRAGAGDRRPHPDRLAGAADGQLRGADGPDRRVPADGHRRLPVPGAPRIRAASDLSQKKQ